MLAMHVPDSDIHTLPRFLLHAPTFPSLHRSKGEVCARVCVIYSLKYGCLRRLGLFCVVPSSLIRHSLFSFSQMTKQAQQEKLCKPHDAMKRSGLFITRNRAVLRSLHFGIHMMHGE